MEIQSNGRLILDGHAGFGMSTFSNTWLTVWCTDNNDCAGDFSEEEEATAIYVRASDAYYNYGVRSLSVYGDMNYGVHSVALFGNGTNYGVYGQAQSGNVNYGVYGTSPSGTNNYAGFFSGDVTVTGNFSSSSDERLKKNVQSLRDTGILDKISLLEPSLYEFLNEDELRQQGLPYINAGERTAFGLIAQELEQVFPELVTDDAHVIKYVTEYDIEEGSLQPERHNEMVSLKSVNYLGLIPVLIAGFQELQAENQELRIRLESLESR